MNRLLKLSEVSILRANSSFLTNKKIFALGQHLSSQKLVLYGYSLLKTILVSNRKLNGGQVCAGLRKLSTNGKGRSRFCKIDLPFRFKLNSDQLVSYQAGMQNGNVGVKRNIRGKTRFSGVSSCETSKRNKWMEVRSANLPLRKWKALENKLYGITPECKSQNENPINSETPDELNNLLLNARKQSLRTTAVLPLHSSDSESMGKSGLNTKSYLEEKTLSQEPIPTFLLNSHCQPSSMRDMQDLPFINIIGSDEHSSTKCPKISACSSKSTKARGSNENDPYSTKCEDPKDSGKAKNDIEGRNRCTSKNNDRSSHATVTGRYCAGGRCHGRRGHQGFVLPGSTEKSRIKSHVKRSAKPDNRSDDEY